MLEKAISKYFENSDCVIKCRELAKSTGTESPDRLVAMLDLKANLISIVDKQVVQLSAWISEDKKSLWDNIKLKMENKEFERKILLAFPEIMSRYGISDGRRPFKYLLDDDDLRELINVDY